MVKGWTVVEKHVYVDDGISGAEFIKRPAFLRMMNALKPRPPFEVLDPVGRVPTRPRGYQDGVCAAVAYGGRGACLFLSGGPRAHATHANGQNYVEPDGVRGRVGTGESMPAHAGRDGTKSACRTMFF
jgi:hypothetical protein